MVDEQAAKFVTITVTARNDEDLSSFIQLCLLIQYLGKVGAAREITVPVDGDGSGQMWFDFGETDVSNIELPNIDDDRIVVGIGN